VRTYTTGIGRSITYTSSAPDPWDSGTGYSRPGDRPYDYGSGSGSSWGGSGWCDADDDDLRDETLTLRLKRAMTIFVGLKMVSRGAGTKKINQLDRNVRSADQVYQYLFDKWIKYPHRDVKNDEMAVALKSCDPERKLYVEEEDQQQLIALCKARKVALIDLPDEKDEAPQVLGTLPKPEDAGLANLAIDEKIKLCVSKGFMSEDEAVVHIQLAMGGEVKLTDLHETLDTLLETEDIKALLDEVALEDIAS
jgi:hypothetical protein